tara:strand:+ start:380 stop:535 length:156 start_codon:yes stop_codon:yes gene_type:complete
VFDVVYYGKLSFQDAYNMPVALRKYWIDRVTEALELENKRKEAEMKAQQPR